ncbi:MAG: hypothetical protein QXX07_03330 [Candidatus Aenigmatarchaeota archaeon]
MISLFLFCSNAYAFCIDRTPPSAPKNLKIYDSPYDSDGNITLVWDPATDGPCNTSAVAYYKIYRSDDGTNFVLIGITNSTSFDDFSSLPEGKYWYKVTAVDNVKDKPHEGEGIIESVIVGLAPSSPPQSGGGSGGSSGGYSTSSTQESQTQPSEEEVPEQPQIPESEGETLPPIEEIGEEKEEAITQAPTSSITGFFALLSNPVYALSFILGLIAVVILVLTLFISRRKK